MPKRLSVRLKSLRENRGISQKFVAEKIGINNSTLSGYESGYREPDAETLKKLADFYEVTTDYLLGRTNNPNFSYNTEKFINELDLGLGVEEILERYNLKYQGKELNIEDVEKIMNVVKTLMSMKK